MASNLQAVIQSLTSYPSTDLPFLSIYLDWSPDGNGKRPAQQLLQQELDRIVAGFDEHSPEMESFKVDRERVEQYLHDEAPEGACALAIFACHGIGVWETVELQVPIETLVVADRYPHVFKLAQVLDDYETYIVVLADAQESYMLAVSLNEAERVGETEAGERIRRFEAGGWAQMLFQRRTENIIKAHTKDIAAELGSLIERYKAQHVIIAGNDSIKGIVLNNLPDQIKQKLVDYIHLDLQSNYQTILDTIAPLMAQVERQQEADDLAKLEEQDYAGGLGVTGVKETAMALSKGQVRQLLISQGFNAAGGECETCTMLHAGTRAKCPYDGGEMRSVNLREAFTARAMQQGADVQIVPASEYLDQHEGVGALLRWTESAQERGS
jgi:peptide subunit release factor 1 (eRF1)